MKRGVAITWITEPAVVSMEVLFVCVAVVAVVVEYLGPSLVNTPKDVALTAPVKLNVLLEVAFAELK